MESRMDGFCDYHAHDPARWVFAFASPDGTDFRDRFLCNGCALLVVGWDTDREKVTMVTGTRQRDDPGQIADRLGVEWEEHGPPYFTYKWWKGVRL